MSRLPILLAIPAMFLSAAASGCTATGPSLEQTLSIQAEPGQALPETVAVTPGFAPSSYAGPTPTEPASGVLAAKQAIAAGSPELDALISRYAVIHEIPVELLRRVVKRESTFNPRARNGPYWGLMQIHPQTARTMGYDGAPDGLLDAETNLKYAGKYLRGAYITAGGDQDQAVRFYSRGYYYDAKRKGLLEETGLRN
jgi:soluble lytic murein transglycosylase-like protein